MRSAFIISGLLIAIGVVGCSQVGLTSAMLGADLNKPRDAISATLNKGASWNVVMPLTPAPFHFGQSRVEVAAFLAKSGYIPEARPFHPRAVPAHAEVYSRTEDGLVCSVRREVYVVFTSNGVLTDASGVSYEAGCL